MVAQLCMYSISICYGRVKQRGRVGENNNELVAWVIDSDMCAPQTQHEINLLDIDLPFGDAGQYMCTVLYCSTDPTQEMCARWSCMYVDRTASTRQITTLFALKYIDHEVGRIYLIYLICI